MIVMASLVLKRRALSCKNRQLIMTITCGTDTLRPRIFYIDPESMEKKGDILWCTELAAELKTKGHWRIKVPGREYQLEDAKHDERTAEVWVRAVEKLRRIYNAAVEKAG